ncbi:MAG: CoA-transferase [Microthrixaceae bacterium]|nr:CoA-transferase [Microthrixaceae bacterium]
MTTDLTRADICAVAIAEAFRGDGERLCNPIGNLPLIGGRLAVASFEPHMMLTDGYYTLMDPTGPDDVPPINLPEAERLASRTVAHWNPYREMFSLLFHGRRHVMMGATQVDRFGNQNIAAIGDWNKPRRQLLGFRGAPGNTINHTTSYWVPNHSPRVFVEAVDVVCGIGYDRAVELGPVASRFHEIRRVVSNLGVFDFEATDDAGVRVMRLASVHPGVSVDEVVEATGFELVIGDDVPETRLPTPEELEIISRLDPKGFRFQEVPAS